MARNHKGHTQQASLPESVYTTSLQTSRLSGASCEHIKMSDSHVHLDVILGECLVEFYLHSQGDFHQVHEEESRLGGGGRAICAYT